MVMETATPMAKTEIETEIELSAYQRGPQPDENGVPVIKAIYSLAERQPDELHGFWLRRIGGEDVVVAYWHDSDLTDIERIPLLEEDGIAGFFGREVQPYHSDAWVNEAGQKIGYEISFNRHFYKPTQLRPLDEILADLVFLQGQTAGLMSKITGFSPASIEAGDTNG